ENGVENAGLPPGLPGLELSGGVQAGELGAGARAAGRAVVGLARTEDEIPAVGEGRIGRRAEGLDVVDLHLVRSGDAVCAGRLPDGPGEGGERLKVREGDFRPLSVDQEKPVPAPRDVAANLAPAGRLDRDIGGEAI